MSKKQLYLLAGGVLAAAAIVYFIRKNKNNQEQEISREALSTPENVAARVQSIMEGGVNLSSEDVTLANEETYSRF